MSTILSGNEEHVIVTVLNGVDSGKTSFCAYLATNALKEKRKVTLIDADLARVKLNWTKQARNMGKTKFSSVILE